MEVIFHVRNFGKIKSADVNISNFALFVGNNNSGKTLLMELIYAVLDQLSYLVDSIRLSADVPETMYIPLKGHYYEIGETEIQRLNDFVNAYLKKQIKRIAQKYFNSNTLLAEEIILEWKNTEEKPIHIIELSKKPSDSMRLNLLKYGLRGYRQALFMPAARTGYMMMYRSYFGKNHAQKGVTKPIHDFLAFLLDYHYSAWGEGEDEPVLDFIYENMIDGKIVEEGDITYYVPKGTEKYVPLMLASSMVNELVPITKMLTNYLPTNFLFYDEVETSMHPSKQMEMVRLLNRLNNSGMKMIVSTHSDAMASKINNMLLLKHADRPFEEIQNALKKKGIMLEAEDILKGDIHVYEFTNQDDGTSTVDELKFRQYPLTGYEFHHFNQSVDDLYEETKTVMGLDDGI